MRKSDTYIKERREELLSWLAQTQTLTIVEICERFCLAQSTARGMLNQMEKEGLLKRCRGGIQLVPSSVDTSQYPTRDVIVDRDQKEAIARAVLSLVKDGDVICLTGGSSTYLVAKQLRHLKNLTVATNSIWVANELIECPQIKVHLCGGVMNHAKGSVVGPAAEQFFDTVCFDKAIIGVDALHLNFGAMSVDSITSHLERKVLTRARQTIILCNHSKFRATQAIDNVASFHDMDYIVTDSAIDPKTLQALRSTGVEVLVGTIASEKAR